MHRVSENKSLSRIILIAVLGIGTGVCSVFGDITTGLQAYLKLDESGGSITANDTTVNTNNGTLRPSSGGPTWVTTGKFNNALQFDSINDYVKINDFNYHTTTDYQFTISFWFKVTTTLPTTSTKALFGHGSNGAVQSLTIYMKNDTLRTYLMNSSSQPGKTALDVKPFKSAYENNVWHLYTLTASPSASPKVVVYLDSVQKASSTSWGGTGVTFNPADSVLLGRMRSTAYYYWGYMDDVRFYNRALSAAEVAELFKTNPDNQKPVANNVRFTGDLKLNSTLTGLFDYSDAESDPPGNHVYQWYRSDNGSGSNKTLIKTGTHPDNIYTLVPADVGKWISVKVTPYATAGASPGNPVESALQGPVINTAPLAPSLSQSSIAEHGSSFTNIGTLTSTDAEGGQITFAIVNAADTANFRISGSTLIAKKAFDFEKIPSYTISVRATDNGGLSTVGPVTVTVTDIAETPAPMSYAGVRASTYSFEAKEEDFPSGPEWVNAFNNMKGCFTSSPQATGVWIVGYILAGGTCQLGFPGTSSDPNIDFDENDRHASCLQSFNSNNIKVYLEVEPGLAKVSNLIELVLNRYQSNGCVIGFGIDWEWFNVTSTGNTTQRVSADSVTAWLTKIKNHNSSYKLFLKHWLPGLMPDYRGPDIVYVDDNQGFPSLSAMTDTFANWANIFSPCQVYYQYGYGFPDADGHNDSLWWRTLSLPARDIGNAIAAKVFNANQQVGAMWVDFTIKDPRVNLLAPYAAPTITTQPQSVTVQPGAKCSLTVAATGNPLLKYQWYKDNVIRPADTFPKMKISSTQPSDNGLYKAVITNGVGTVTSNEARITCGQQYTLTIQVSGSGTTNPAPGNTQVPGGTDFPITAIPGVGYYFVNWTATGGLTIENPTDISTRVLNVTSTGTVTANFAINTYLLTVAAGSGGTIIESATSPVAVDHGSPTTITASPNDRFIFINWTITSGAADIADPNATSTMVTLTSGDATVTANFDIDPVWRRQDSIAIVALYENTYGPSWTNSTNWLTQNPINTWYGVTVANNRITQLSLEDNGLNGEIPGEIGCLTALTMINLHGNGLNGSIPSSIGLCVELNNLNLSNNRLTGEIPFSIGNLINLTELHLFMNQLNGSVPQEISNAAALTSFNIQDNQIAILPDQITTLPVLSNLNIRNNRLCSVSPTIQMWLDSVDWGWSSTQICGGRPLDSLTLVNLYNSTNGANWSNKTNWLVPGTKISDWYGVSITDDRVTAINLQSNGLNGTLPTDIGNLTNLLVLNLSSNQIYGTIPAEICLLTNLHSIYLNQ